MPITAEQRELRKKHLGSSDIPAMLGLSPYKSAYDLWLEKTGKLIEADNETPAMRAGTRFENGVLDDAEEQLGELRRNVWLCKRGGAAPIASNIDAVVLKTGDPVEAKTAGLFGPLTEWWGQEGTDQVPDRVIAQCQVHLLVTEAEVCHVPTFLGGRGFAMFEIPRNVKIINAIIDAAEHFWQEHVLRNVEPHGSRASLEVVKLIKREPQKVTTIEPELVEAWLETRDVASEAQKVADQAKADVLAALGDAEAAMAGPMGAITYYETKRKGYTVEPTTFRTLRHRKKGL